jgi:hypothetical protein
MVFLAINVISVQIVIALKNIPLTVTLCLLSMVVFVVGNSQIINKFLNDRTILDDISYAKRKSVKKSRLN